MKVRPITFTAAEVRAILEGRKTQFRRIIKPQPAEGLAWRGIIYCSTTKAHEGMHSFTDQVPCVSQAQRIRCQFGNPRNGDRLRIKDPRTILAIESVRVERLQDITEEGAKAEGVEPTDFTGYEHPDYPTLSAGAYRNGFIEQCGDALWAANSWVWVVEFRVVEGGHE